MVATLRDILSVHVHAFPIIRNGENNIVVSKFNSDVTYDTIAFILWYKHKQKEITVLK